MIRINLTVVGVQQGFDSCSARRPALLHRSDRVRHRVVSSHVSVGPTLNPLNHSPHLQRGRTVVLRCFGMRFRVCRGYRVYYRKFAHTQGRDSQTDEISMFPDFAGAP